MTHRTRLELPKSTQSGTSKDMLPTMTLINGTKFSKTKDGTMDSQKSNPVSLSFISWILESRNSSSNSMTRVPTSCHLKRGWRKSEVLFTKVTLTRFLDTEGKCIQQNNLNQKDAK